MCLFAALDSLSAPTVGLPFQLPSGQVDIGTADCSLSPRDKQRWPFPWWDLQWRERHNKACRWWHSTEELPIPEPWQPFARAVTQKVKYVGLKLPVSNGTYDSQWGQTPFPTSRGRYSTAFQEWLQRDVPQIWPDPEASADPGAKLS
jgi:hypothetical protein